MNNNTIYLAVTVAFMIGLAIIGIMISRGVKSSEDWMVAGKSLGKIPMAGTYFATIVSATSIMSYMGYYYLNGWPGWWNAAGTLMTSFLACIYFARKVRQSECNTLPEFIEKRYSRAFSIPASLLVVLCCTALLANQVTGAVILLQSAAGLYRLYLYRRYEGCGLDGYGLRAGHHRGRVDHRGRIPVPCGRLYRHERGHCCR